RRHMIAVVLHRRRRRNAQRLVPRQVVDGLAADLALERHARDPLLFAEERAQRARIYDGAGEEVRADLLALVEHREGHVAEPLGDGRLGLEQLPQADRARETGRPRPYDEYADVDSFVRQIRRLGDDLAQAERRRVIRRLHDLRCFTSSVSLGTISCRSPTTPRSANSKIGALPSLLIATTTPELCMPPLC